MSALFISFWLPGMSYNEEHGESLFYKIRAREIPIADFMPPVSPKNMVPPMRLLPVHAKNPGI